MKVESQVELVPMMNEAFGPKYRNKLVFLDVDVDPEEHVYPMAIKGGSMRDMFLARSDAC
jgi:acetolactate synthase-1/2/3 large subunit